MKNNERKISIIITSIVVVILLIVGVSYAYFSNTKKSDNRVVNADNLKITYSDENMASTTDSSKDLKLMGENMI